MNRDKAITKARKLWALASKAGTQKECEAASAKAWEIMRGHDLNIAEVLMVEQQEPPKPQPVPDQPRNVHEWPGKPHRIPPVQFVGPGLHPVIVELLEDVVEHFRYEFGIRRAPRRRRA